MAEKSDTWMAFYIGDYLADTMHLTVEQHGAYLLLILAYWRNRGPLQANETKLRAIARMSDRQWQQNRDTLAEFFQVGDGQWRHTRIDKELAKADDITNKRSAAGRASAQHKANKRSTSVEHTNQQTIQQTAIPLPSQSPSSSLRSEESKISPASQAPPSKADAPFLLKPDEEIAEIPAFLVKGDLGQAIAAWNAIAKTAGFPSVDRLTAKRRRKLSKRLRDCGGIEGWKAAMERVAASPFLRGERPSRGHENWKCSFDFILDEEHFTKLMEGNYDDRKAAASADIKREILEATVGLADRMASD